MLIFDKKILKNDIELLTKPQRMILTACCLSRILPSYERAAQMDRLETAVTFAKLVDVLWYESTGGLFSDSNDYEHDLEFVALDGEDCNHAMAEVAYCASVMATLAYRSAQLDKIDKAASALEQAYLAAKRFGVRKDGPKGNFIVTEETDAREIAHPLVQRELARQQEDLALLKVTAQIDEKFVADLKLKQQRQDMLEGYI